MPRGSLLDLPLFASEEERQQRIAETRAQLRAASVSDATRAQYQAAVERYRHYCRSLPPHPHLPPSHRDAAPQVDSCISGYLSLIFCVHAGRMRAHATNVIYGMYWMFPTLRGELRISEQVLVGWNRCYPSESHPPLTWPLAVLIALTMAYNGYPVGGLATLVAFDGLLRIDELCQLRVSDVSFLGDPRRGAASISSASSSATAPSAPSGRAILRIAQAKTGRNQSSELFNEDVVDILCLYVRHRRTDQILFPLGSADSFSSPSVAYRRSFEYVCKAWGLREFGFVPHSLRHGGATHAILHQRQSIETVLQRGRWASTSSARIYLQQGRAELLERQIPQAVMRRATAGLNDWPQRLRAQLLSALTGPGMRIRTARQ